MNFIWSAVALTAMLSPMVSAHAEAYPSGPVRIVEAFAPGGSTDFMSRYIAAKTGVDWGQSVVVDNRPGASGQIGATSVVKAKPDGYTLLTLPNDVMSLVPQLYKMPVDLSRELTPIASVARVPMVMVVHPSVPASNVKEFIDLAKAQAGKLAYGSAGEGTLHHLSGALFSTMTRVEMVHVPYKGTTLAVNDLLGGQIQVVFSPISAVLPHIKSGKLKAIGVASSRRVAVLPGVPTLSESGVPGYVSDLWVTLFAPAKTPQPVIDKWSAQLKKITASEETRATLAVQGIEPDFDTADSLARRFDEDRARWQRVIEQAGIKLN